MTFLWKKFSRRTLTATGEPLPRPPVRNLTLRALSPMCASPQVTPGSLLCSRCPHARLPRPSTDGLKAWLSIGLYLTKCPVKATSAVTKLLDLHRDTEDYTMRLSREALSRGGVRRRSLNRG